MIFTEFWEKLSELQNSISITQPIATQVKKSYWGTPAGALLLPCAINALAEPERIMGFGSRDQRIRINVQLLVQSAQSQPERTCLIATALWFAAKDAFDGDVTLGGAVPLSTLRGADPTVPVILTHAGQAYIGFNAFLDIHAVEAFEF